jgi:hypothetical protein
MAVRKRSKSTKRNGQAFGVIVEELRGHFRVYGEALAALRQTMDERFDQVDRLFGAMDRRFADVDRRFDQVDQRFTEVDRRFDHVDRRLDRTDSDIGLVKAAVLEHARELKEIRVILEKKADREEVPPPS